MPAVFDQRYVKRLDGPNVKKGKNKRDLAEQLIADIRAFKSKHGCDRMVMIWVGSTEVYMKETAAHASVASFEKALEQNDDSIPSSMIYVCGHSRGAAVCERGAEPHGRRSGHAGAGGADEVAAGRQRHENRADVDQDDHRPGPQGTTARREGVVPRTSSATATARCSTTPSRSKRRKRARSRLSTTSSSRTYPDLYQDLCHVVRINYYPPRGDNKEGWDNIDLIGWLGYPMQLKINSPLP